MSRHKPRSVRAQAPRLGFAVALTGLAVAVALASCVIFDEGSPQNARVVIGFEAGPAGAASNLQLIVSNNFATSGAQQGGQTNVTLRSADTIRLSLPYDQLYSIGAAQRFFAQIANLDSIPVVLSIKVDLDGDLRMDQVTAVGEPVEFLYVLASF